MGKQQNHASPLKNHSNIYAYNTESINKHTNNIININNNNRREKECNRYVVNKKINNC